MKDEPKKSAAREILDYEREVNEALRGFRKRTNYEPATADMPLYDVLGGDDDGDLDVWAIRNETVRRLFAYFLSGGVHPAQVLRRVYAIGVHMMIEPFSLLTVRERGKLLGTSHGTEHWLMQKLCVDPLEKKGAKSVKAPGQKGKAASEAASIAQQGNHNRTGGHSANGSKPPKSRKKKAP